jgi:hypothetical protein
MQQDGAADASMWRVLCCMALSKDGSQQGTGRHTATASLEQRTGHGTHRASDTGGCDTATMAAE